jgi:putative membrane protein
MNYLTLILCALIGALLSSFLSCVPALHVYNVAGLSIIIAMRLVDLVPGEALAMFMMGMVVGYAILNAIPSIFLTVPDESTIFIVLPGQKYLVQGRGYEAAVLTGIGSLGGLFFLSLFSPLFPMIFPIIRRTVAPHLHWILGLVIAYMLLSEWPKGTERAKTSWGKLLEGWKSLIAGLATFLLSGVLGFILIYRSLIPIEASFQSLLPAFVGLFAIPWLIQNILSMKRIPSQNISKSIDISLSLITRGVGAGALGGLFAAFFPVVTGGIGGFLAGHATAQRDDRLFIISQGASKLVYYVGAFLLLFVPGLHLTRGGMAWILSVIYTPHTPEMYYVAVAAMAISGALSFLLLLPLSRLVIRVVARLDYRKLSFVVLLFILGIVLWFTGWMGISISIVASGIGLIPVLWHSRRMNCMGVLLLPLCLNIAGLGTTLAGWLGLI